MPAVTAGKTLAYDRAIVPQETGYWCGPGSTQIVLNSAGIKVSEQELAREMGTTTNGTDTIDLVCAALRRRLPQAGYTTQWLPNNPTPPDVDVFWSRLTAAIGPRDSPGGHGMVVNFWAPPSNHPRPVPPSDPTLGPRYGGGTVWHYVAAMGWLDDGARKVWIADPGFSPFGYFITAEQCVSLIGGKGYAYATAVNSAPVPQPQPAPQPQPVPAPVPVPPPHRPATVTVDAARWAEIRRLNAELTELLK